jgi:hypothetical protein
MTKQATPEMIEALRSECDRLRELAHEAPLNKVFETHTGHKFLGTHSTAWADRSREWMAACARLDAALATQNTEEK